MDKNTISSGLEDYIEAIYIAHTNNTQIKGTELARNLKVSRASVSEAIARLVSKNLIEYNNKNISLTEEGIEIAKGVYNKHSILKDFLITILNISQEDAEENACKIEHMVSQEIIDKLSSFTNYCKNNTEILEKYRSMQ